MVSKGYYAVQRGRSVGVYSTWDECKAQVNGFSGAVFRKLNNYKDAAEFVKGINQGHEQSNKAKSSSKSADSKSSLRVSKASSTSKNGSSKLYSVKSTNVNVANKIFNNWSDCQEYVKGQKGVSIKKFSDEASARGYIDGSLGNSRDFELIGMSKDEFLSKFKLRGSTKFDRTIKVYCDGSALSNGQSESRAGYGIYFENLPEKSISEPLRSGPQTNNRAEILAVSHALDIIWQDLNMNSAKSAFSIHTDSEYVAKLLNDRYATYSDADLRKLANADLTVSMVKRFAKVKQYYQVNKDIFANGGSFKIIWVKGHAGEAGNEEADRLARQGAKCAR